MEKKKKRKAKGNRLFKACLCDLTISVANFTIQISLGAGPGHMVRRVCSPKTTQPVRRGE